LLLDRRLNVFAQPCLEVAFECSPKNGQAEDDEVSIF